MTDDHDRCEWAVVAAAAVLITSQGIGWVERPQNDLFCVEWDVKHLLNQSVSHILEEMQYPLDCFGICTQRFNIAKLIPTMILC